MITFAHNEFDAGQLRRSVYEILESNTLLAMATVRGSDSYINTAYYCYTKELRLYILTEPSSQHCRNLEANSSAACAIYDSTQIWSKPKSGLQLFGQAGRSAPPEDEEALALYTSRFPELSKWIRTVGDFDAGTINSRFYTFEVSTLKLFDEVKIAPDRFIELTPIRA